jgi:hypothetical protein
MFINLPCPEFERQYGFDFQNREAQDEAMRTTLGDDSVHEIASQLLPVHFC